VFNFVSGLGAELYYIRDGVLNQYALKFNVPIPANISDLNFTWRSLAPRTVSVSLLIFLSAWKFIQTSPAPRESNSLSYRGAQCGAIFPAS